MSLEFEFILFQGLLVVSVATFIVVAFCIFFDQALFLRGGTVFRVRKAGKKVALTFDDGPSEIWTPLILDALKKAGIKATFFMIGAHVKKFPEIARRVAQEGHTVGNHGYAHSVLLYYTDEELEEEIKYTELVIQDTTGQSTKYFRPPKAWLRGGEKRKIQGMGYDVVLWSINPKDWVPFHHRCMVNFISWKVGGGDIILFHDSGAVFKAEGGDRMQTVFAIPLLAEKLRAKGFEFVTIEQLIHEQ